jgi:hypothetical protein
MKRIALLPLGVLMAAGGCTHWKYVPEFPEPREGPSTFGAARVTPGGNGMILVLRDVEVTADSVIGWEGEQRRDRRRVALHRDQVLMFERRAVDPWRTGSAAVLAVLVVYGAAVVYFLNAVMI